MDEDVRIAISEQGDYQRLQKEFPLDFLVECLTDPNRPANGGGRMIGNILRRHVPNPSLFVCGVHYHELVEFEEKRKMGYTKQQLSEATTDDPNHPEACRKAKLKEFGFYNDVSERVLGCKLPKISIVFASNSVASDYEIPFLPYNEFYEVIRGSKTVSIQDRFTMRDVENAITMTSSAP